MQFKYIYYAYNFDDYINFADDAKIVNLHLYKNLPKL